MTQFVYAIESLSVWVGRAFGVVLVLTFSGSYEVFVRYVLNSPTVWAWTDDPDVWRTVSDGGTIRTGTGHARPWHVLYRLPSDLASTDRFRSFAVLFPGILALFWWDGKLPQTAGATRREGNHRRASKFIFQDTDTGGRFSADPAGGMELVRCWRAMKSGYGWSQDVRETEDMLMEEAK